MKQKATLSIQRWPSWLMIMYVSAIAGMIPWIISLAYSLPARHLSRNWDVTWVGFDLVLLGLLVMTAWLGYRRSVWIVLPATALTVLLVADAWFDVTTSRPGSQLALALIMGLALEVPLAAASLWLAVKTMLYLTTRNRG